MPELMEALPQQIAQSKKVRSPSAIQGNMLKPPPHIQTRQTDSSVAKKAGEAHRVWQACSRAIRRSECGTGLSCAREADFAAVNRLAGATCGI